MTDPLVSSRLFKGLPLDEVPREGLEKAQHARRLKPRLRQAIQEELRLRDQWVDRERCGGNT
jgi:hypothetical protein